MDFWHRAMRAVAGVVGVGRFVAMRVLPAVGAGFRLERGFGFDHRATKTAHHFRQHVVGLEAQAATAGFGDDLHRHVAVAEMVGGAGEELGIAGDGLDQFFRRGQDFDHRATILGRQSVAERRQLCFGAAQPA